MIVAIAAILAASSSVSFALAIPASTPVSGPAESASVSGPLKVVVTGLQGHAEVLPAPDGTWQKVTVGMELIEGCQFRTGPKGAVQFTVGTDTIYRVDRLSLVEVVRARLKPDGTIGTDVGMTYGRVSKDLDAPVRVHDDTIISPGSALAVRGTRVSLYDQPPYQPEAVSLTGRAVYQNIKRQKVPFGGKGTGTAKMVGGGNGAAETAIDNTRIDPLSPFAGRTQTEDILVLSLQSIGGTSLEQLPGVLGGIFSKNFKGTGVGVLPVQRQLEFITFWTGTPFSDVDLTVISPKGEVLSNTSLTSGSSGVHSAPNGVADRTGFGSESVVFTISYPVGQYTIKNDLKSGSTQNVQTAVIQDPQTTGTVLAQFTDTLNAATPSATHVVQATATTVTPMAVTVTPQVKTVARPSIVRQRR
jgi:hypothetical protein